MINAALHRVFSRPFLQSLTTTSTRKTSAGVVRPFPQSQRFLSVRRGNRRRQSRRTNNQGKKRDDTAINQQATAQGVSRSGATTTTTTTQVRLLKIWNRYVSPNRFVLIEGGKKILRRPLQNDEYRALALRLPFALAFFVVVLWEETSPLAIVRLSGPSMLPSMAADQSEIWIISPMRSIWRRFLFTPKFRHNDLVGFTPPPTVTSNLQGNDRHVSCKRIIGLPGDRVNRYGAFAHLHVPQDPTDWGILWPPSTQSTEWEKQSRYRANRHPDDSIVVPEGHVWVEADCPGLGLDSRQLGPIPMSSIRGRILGRLWPLWRSKLEDPLYVKNISQRPHPIPLDQDTLRLYNVHRNDFPNEKS